MEPYTRYTTEWKLEQVVPYLLWHYFENQPTTNTELCRAFWALMGKDVHIEDRILWHDVAYQIDRLKKASILKEVRVKKDPLVSIYAFVIGRHGKKHIREFLACYSQSVIRAEILQYLGAVSVPHFPQSAFEKDRPDTASPPSEIFPPRWWLNGK